MNAFEELLNLIKSLDLGRNLVIILLASAIFSSCLWLLLITAKYSDPQRRRLASLLIGEQPKVKVPTWEILVEKFEGLSYIFLPRNIDSRKRIIDRLTHAGYQSYDKLFIYYFIRFLLIILFPLIIFFLIRLFMPNIEIKTLILYQTIGVLLGMIGPSYYLDIKISERQRILRNALPDVIDLLVVCMEAGLGLNAAILRVAQLIVDAHPDLAEELLQVSSEIRAGIDRTHALSNLAQRTGLEDIQGLVMVLAQSMRFGTSIAQTLRIYSDEFRTNRMRKADEAAAKASTKMLLPLTLCFLPTFFIVSIGPALITGIEVMSNINK